MILRLLSRCLQRRNLPLVLLRRLNHHQTRKFSIIQRKFCSANSDTENIESADYEIAAEEKTLSIRDLLYPGSEDVVLKEINRCTKSDELLKFIEDSQLQRHQLCQMIVVYWDVTETAQSQDVLDNLTSKVNNFLDEMTTNELSVVFIYLNKLGVSIRHPTMEKITDKILFKIKNDEDFPTISLSRFTFALNSEKSLYSSLLAVQAIPQITKKLESCQDAAELQLLTVCLNNISNIVSLELLEKFKRKVEELLESDKVNETESKLIIKIINFLNYPHWSFRNGVLIRKLLLELEENIKIFETRNLVTINRAFQSQIETARLVPLMVKRAQELIKLSPSVDLLSLAVLHNTPDQRTKIALMVKNFLSLHQISTSQSGETLQVIFKILRLLKISDLDLCDSYWTKVLNEVYSSTQPNLVYVLSKYVQKYMFFNNNLGGTYRNIEYEKCMKEMLMTELKSAYVPKDFASFASFIIAYGDDNKIPQFIVDKIEEIHWQFSIRDCLQLSRGLQIMQELRFKSPMNSVLADQVDSINFSLGKCAERHIEMKNLHITEMNAIIRAYSNRKATRETQLFHRMIKYYDSDNLDLNSRTIRDVAYNLTSSNFRNDAICDRFIDYILDNWDHVTGDTVEKILTCCYNFSYFPEKLEVFDRSSEIIVRDFNYMSGLNIVQALLALIFYKSCPQTLIAMVFSSDFIKRLEQEIAMCYSRNSYPQRVMNQVMQLNRAVCLDCPEINVKWFQQSFMEAQASKMPAIQGRLHNEVKSLLLTIVKKPEYLITNCVTPYGYRVDFELYMDQYNRFVKPPAEDFQNVNYMPNVSKIAILLLSNKVFCENDLNRLRGHELLRMRHLEMLGYRVIHVKINDFNALFKNVKAKIKYLKNVLQLTA